MTRAKDISKILTDANISGTLDVTGETTLATHLNLGDNDKIKLGASGDLEIFHDGTNSNLKDTGTGSLNLIASTKVQVQGVNGETMAIFNEDGAVELRHNDVKKIETTSSGVTVTGGLTTTTASSIEGGAVFNEASADVDFRVESNGNANMLFVDGGNNIVGIGRVPATNDGGAGSLQLEGNDGIAFRRNGQTNSFLLRPFGSGDGLRFTQGGTGDRVVIDSSGNVGIGTTSISSSDKLSISGGRARIVNSVAQSGNTLDNSSFSGLIINNSNNANGDLAGIVMYPTSQYTAAAGVFGYRENQTAAALSFWTGSNTGSERMRINSIGQVTLGGASHNDDILYLIRGNNGKLIRFYRGSNEEGEISVVDNSGGGGILIGHAEVHLMINRSSTRFVPSDGSGGSLDNAVALGASNRRFSAVFGASSSINTSDENEKQDIEALSATETKVAVACKGLIKKYRWKDAVAKKGNDARIHVGVIAQELKSAFEAEGLDASKYGMFCSDTWWEKDETIDGVISTQDYATEDKAPEGATKVTRLGVRYDELLAFIISAI